MDEHHARKADRVTLHAHVDIRRPGDHRYKVAIEDFSSHGCRVEIPVYVDEGDGIYISLPGLETIEGKVRWKKHWQIGVEFARPLHPAVFDMIRKKMAQG